MIKERVLEGSGELRSSNLVQKPVFLIGSSRPSEQHAVDTVRVDLFVIYRRLLCDFSRRCRDMASIAELASETLKCSRRCKEMFWTFQSG